VSADCTSIKPLVHFEQWLVQFGTCHQTSSMMPTWSKQCEQMIESHRKIKASHNSLESCLVMLDKKQKSHWAIFTNMSVEPNTLVKMWQANSL
jgi:hypothetical protein